MVQARQADAADLIQTLPVDRDRDRHVRTPLFGSKVRNQRLSTGWGFDRLHICFDDVIALLAVSDNNS